MDLPIKLNKEHADLKEIQLTLAMEHFIRQLREEGGIQINGKFSNHQRKSLYAVIKQAAALLEYDEDK